LTHRYRGQICALPPIWLPFLLWGGWALLSLTWSLEPERTLKEWRNEVFYTGAALWICYVGAQAPAAARIFLPVLAAAGAAACVFALRDFAQGPEHYATGWHGGPGDHSSALLLLMPCAAMTGWYLQRIGAARWQKGLPWVIAALFLASSYSTLNRTVWLGLIVEAFLLGALVLHRRRVVQDAPALTSGAKLKLSAAAVCVLVGGLTLMLHVHASREGAADPAPLTRDSRADVWRETMGWIAEKPLTGYGFGRGMLRDALRVELQGRNLWHAHNSFLDAVVQTGVPGLALFLLLLAAVVRAGWRASRDVDYGTAASGIALLGIVAGMVVRNMSDTLLVRQNALLFWGTVGVLLAWGARRWRA
jgi:O-antigen ligase